MADAENNRNFSNVVEMDNISWRQKLQKKKQRSLEAFGKLLRPEFFNVETGNLASTTDNELSLANTEKLGRLEQEAAEIEKSIQDLCNEVVEAGKQAESVEKALEIVKTDCDHQLRVKELKEQQIKTLDKLLETKYNSLMIETEENEENVAMYGQPLADLTSHLAFEIDVQPDGDATIVRMDFRAISSVEPSEPYSLAIKIFKDGYFESASYCSNIEEDWLKMEPSENGLDLRKVIPLCRNLLLQRCK